MTDPDNRVSTQETPRSKVNRDIYMMNSYYSLQREMNATKRHQTGSMRRSQSAVRMRVVDNNRRGKSIDKITEDHMKTEPAETKSIYQQDYTLKRASRELENRRSSQNFGERLNSSHYRSHSELRGSTHRPSVDYNARDTNTSRFQLHTEESQPEINENQSNMRVNTVPDEPTEKKPKVFKMRYTDKWEPYYKIPKKPTKLGLDFNGMRQSLYRRDFKGQPKDVKGIVMKNDFYTTFQNRETMDLRSTMRTDFKNWNQGPPKREGPKNGLKNIPFGGRSNYKSEFVDWRHYVANHEKAPQHVTVIPEIRMIGKTIYKDDFAVPPKEKEDSDIVTKKPKEGVFSQTVPFLGETSYQKSFKGFKVGNHQGFIKAEADYRPGTSYSGNFRTTFGTDFGHPKERTYWPGENEEEDEFLTQAFLA